MCKRIFAVLLTFCLLFTLLPAAGAAERQTRFSDVMQPDLWYYPAVYWAAELGITKGTGAGRFSPDEGCTRAQIVTFLWRAAGEPEPHNGKSGFKDIQQNQYYDKAVLWAVEKGIATGVDKDHFCPETPCTRGMAATFLWRAAQKPECLGGRTAFSDVTAGAYYGDAVQWAVENGITNGTGRGRFQPDGKCSRAHIVTFLYRAAAEDLEDVYLLYNDTLRDGARYRIPQLRMDTPDARKINREIEQKYGGIYLEEKGNDAQGLSVVCREIDYTLYRHGEILCLVVRGCYYGDSFFYDVYNIDLRGQTVDNAALLRAAGVPEAEFIEQAQQAAEAVFAKKYQGAPHDALYEAQLAFTVAPEQIHLGMRMFLNEEGRLMLISKIGSLAGADSYEEVYAWKGE